MSSYSVAIIGGGAAGLCAAILAARLGDSVVVCEQNHRLGKKILVTGNGRCNLLNADLNETYYNLPARELVKSVFSVFGRAELTEYFQGLGLHLYSNQGRIFPATNQAASVLSLLEMEIKRLSVSLELNFECTGITPRANGFLVSSRGRQSLHCTRIILAGGGQSYPALGSTGSLLAIAQQLGHALVEPVPVAVPLVVRDNLCQILQGQRIAANATSLIEGREGQSAGGELLFAKYGLSGTCILDISEEISIALNRLHKDDVRVLLDLVPFLELGELARELEKRRTAGTAPSDMLLGILPNKFGPALKHLFAGDDCARAARLLKKMSFRVSATRGWNEAEFTAGGINLGQVDRLSLQSKLVPNLYFAGEMLDVNGVRGGYNLAWAWASGLLAGLGPRARPPKL